MLPLTFDRIEIKRCGWSQCVCLTETHRLIGNMTYLGHHVTLRDLDLRSHFDLGLSMSTCIYFDASNKKNAMASELFR